MGLAGLDTRALTKHLRERGTMRGVLTTGDRPADQLANEAHETRLAGLVTEVTTPRPYRIFGDGPRVVVVDYGVKYNILRSLQAYDCDIMVAPATMPAEDILEFNPAGVLLSNGPGDPKDIPEAAQIIRELVGQVAMFGICLGHQLLGQAFGGRTFKLKFGHRGANQPVHDLMTGRIEITAQNHGFAVDEASLPKEIEVTHKHLSDGTVEGLRHTKLPIFSLQHHPEASPGPHDAHPAFQRFVHLMESNQR